MKITLYKNKSDTRYVTKKLELVSELTGTLKQQCSILNPSIILELNTFDFNYVKIDEFNRYYYVDNITSIRNNLVQIDCSVDVLMSHKEDILKTNCLVDSVKENFDNFIKSDVDVECGTNTEIIEFENGFNDTPNFVLCTLSGSVETFEIEDDKTENNNTESGVS